MPAQQRQPTFVSSILTLGLILHEGLEETGSTSGGKNNYQYLHRMVGGTAAHLIQGPTGQLCLQRGLHRQYSKLSQNTPQSAVRGASLDVNQGGTILNIYLSMSVPQFHLKTGTGEPSVARGPVRIKLANL